MIAYTMQQLVAALDLRNTVLPKELRKRLVTGVSTDTRSVRPGDVFFGIRGETFDGSRFAGQALAAGAALAVVNRDAPDVTGGPLVRVEDTVRALGDVARDYRTRFSGPVIAITGTNGKTTVKEMLLAVLRTRFRTHGTIGNLNNHIGLPLSIFGLDRIHQCAVFELGMSAPGEIAYLAEIAQPDTGIILNVGEGHMEFFPNLDAVADAKTELLRALTSDGTAILNNDDPLLRARENGGVCRVIRFGVNSLCDFRAEGIVVHDDGCPSFRVGGYSIRLRVPGVHNVYNALAAWSTGRLMRIRPMEIIEALESFAPPKMRMQSIEVSGVRYINDCYNANPLSMRAAADVLGVMRIPEEGRLVAVLGDMRELGEMTGAAHREIGHRFGELRPALLCLVGEQAPAYREGALRSGMDPDAVRLFGNADEARDFLREVKRPGDVIFVKGSRALGMETIVETPSE